jgi:hypothetical protein
MDSKVVLWYTECVSCSNRAEIHVSDSLSSDEVKEAFANIGIKIRPYVCPSCAAKKGNELDG